MQNRILSKEDLSQYPSVVQTKPMQRANMKYSFIPTTQIIDDLAKEGWLPFEVQETDAKKADRGFQKHLVRFFNPDIKNPGAGFEPNVLMTNAHNGSSSTWIMGGGINFVCTNGIIIAENIVANHRIRHQGSTEDQVKSALQDIVENLPRVYNSIDRFKSIILNDKEKENFGRDSLRLFYDEPQLEKLDLQASSNLLVAPRRKAERENTLWNAFNLVQENMIRGGDFLVPKTGGKIKHKRETKSIDTNVRINTTLWEYAEEVAETPEILKNLLTV
jgi:hypothetical protein